LIKREQDNQDIQDAQDFFTPNILDILLKMVDQKKTRQSGCTGFFYPEYLEYPVKNG